MAKQTLKVGDKVLFLSYSSNRSSIPTIRDFREEIKKVPYGNRTTKLDVTLEFPDGSTYRTTKDKIYKPDQRTITLFGKKKWDVIGVKADNGYFGSYSCIEYDGKKAIVFCDDRDAIVHIVTDWYDDILYGKGGFSSLWSGDGRWNCDKPLVVYVKRKGYNINAKHTNQLLCDVWLKSIEPKWYYDRTMGHYLKGVNKKGQEVIISERGTIQLASLANPKNIDVVMRSVKEFTNDEVLHLWIEKGLPCAYIRGLEYKGAGWGFVSKENAIELFKTHKSFSGSFNSAEWRVLDNQVTLLFRDYADSDYD